MDISFTCDKCGQNIVIDNAGSGITIDCPECGKPVTCRAPPRRNRRSPGASGTEAVDSRGHASPATAACGPTRNNPLVPSYTNIPKSTVHPSIAAGVHCLVILVAIEFVGFW